MIEFTTGNIFDAKAEALVNTVNCVGVMGRGVAMQFKRAYPENFKAYKKACDAKEVFPGKMFVHDLNAIYGPRYIINFPTKRHWKGKSRLEDVEAGLYDLIDVVDGSNISSIAIPPLGCGLGGLDWADVRPLIVKAFGTLPAVSVILYEPVGAPAASKMAIATEVPKMTMGRATLLGLIHRYLYAAIEPIVTLVEAHKLMYFMQAAGEPLKLQYAKAMYGPYAENLRHVLNPIEGHFITGYGEAEDSPLVPLEIRPQAVEQATTFLTGHKDTLDRFNRVADLFEGFETAYGMELLATVHWVATKEQATTPELAVEKVHAWNERKKTFDSYDIQFAWQHLHQKGWLSQIA
jgi:O-acetyl-ADP-ribose deacetylase (regulator of RNase III)